MTRSQEMIKLLESLCVNKHRIRKLKENKYRHSNTRRLREEKSYSLFDTDNIQTMVDGYLETYFEYLDNSTIMDCLSPENSDEFYLGNLDINSKKIVFDQCKKVLSLVKGNNDYIDFYNLGALSCIIINQFGIDGVDFDCGINEDKLYNLIGHKIDALLPYMTDQGNVGLEW